MRYTEFVIALSILKGSANMICNRAEKNNMWALLLDFSWKVKLRTPVLFGFLDTFINEFKAITVRYLEFLNLLSILNSAVDINQNSFEKCKM